jgi:hypothetical protein
MTKRVVRPLTASREADCPTCIQEGKKAPKVCHIHGWCSQGWFDVLQWRLPLSTLPTPPELE